MTLVRNEVENLKKMYDINTIILTKKRGYFSDFVDCLKLLMS